MLDSLKAKGFKNIYLLKKEAINLDIETMVDGTHPNDIGMMRYANAYEKKLKRILKYTQSISLQCYCHLGCRKWDVPSKFYSKVDESGKPFHIQQAEQIRLFKEAWKKAGHQREPRISVSRSLFALVTDQDRLYFGKEAERVDQIGMIEPGSNAIFGRSYAAEPDQLIRELAKDEAIQEADTLLLTIPIHWESIIMFMCYLLYWSMLLRN